MIVKISSSEGDHRDLLLRQLPGNGNTWRGVKFFVNSPVEKCDWWVVLHSSGLREPEETVCDPGHLVFASMEPPDADHPLDFIRQFSHVISADKNISHPNLIRITAHTWWAGYRVKFSHKGHLIQKEFNYNYDSFTRLAVPEAKENKISVITSTKSFWPGHARRLEFLEKLRKHPISASIDFFGAGGIEIEDKLDGLLPYKYHLALENSSVEDYWTEKFADPLLGWCLPLYSGCPNLANYFPTGSYVPIEISDFDGAVRKLQDVLSTNLYEDSIQFVAKARHMILNEYNLFNLLSDICREPARGLQMVKLHPARKFKVKKFDQVMKQLKTYF